ncbi:MAG: ABC transporter permease [Chloroflexi bacterium]|jgi:ABC-2 type transport system permease protein|nr:ABC transporter permease [Chloroflexota bacterium]
MPELGATDRRIIDLAIKDLRQITRDRKSFLYLLIMPIAFTLLFGFAFGGNSTADPRLPIGLADKDSSELSRQLVTMLAASDVVRIAAQDTGTADLQRQVVEEEIAAAVLIPAGFGSRLLDGDPVPVTIVGSGQAGFTVEGEVETGTARLLSALQAANLSVDTAINHNLLPSESKRQAHFAEAFIRALAAWEAPPVAIRYDESSALADEVEGVNSNYSVFAHSSPGMMAQFAIAGLLGAAGILVVEKKTRSVQRLLTTNMSKSQILAGHFLAMFVMIFLQLTVLILFGQLFLDLPYLGQPLATLTMTVVTALFCASLGMLIGAVARKQEQVVVLSLVPMFVLSALGGAWVPLEFTPQTFQRVAYMTPLAWVLDGYKDILVRGQGLEALGTAVLILLGYAMVLLALAVWRFRVD